MVKNYNFSIGLKVLSLLFLTSNCLLFLSLETFLPAFQVFFLISLVGLVIMLPWLIVVKEEKLRVKSYRPYIYRSIFNIAGMISWIEALKLISYNEAYNVDYMTPIFTTILAILFCNERLSLKLFFVMLANILGIYIFICGTNLLSASEGTIVAIFATFMWSCYDVACKLHSSDDIFIQLFYTFFFTVMLSIPFAIMVWEPIVYSELNIIPIMAFLAIFSSLTIFYAYKHSPLIILMPFTFSKALFIELGVYLFFEENLERGAFVGLAIIFVSMSYFFYQQYRGKVSY